MRKTLMLLLVGSVGIISGYAHPFTSQDGKLTGIDCDRTKTGEFTKDDKYELNF